MTYFYTILPGQNPLELPKITRDMSRTYRNEILMRTGRIRPKPPETDRQLRIRLKLAQLHKVR